MAERPGIYSGFVVGPEGELREVVAVFNGSGAYIADNNGQDTEPERWGVVKRFRYIVAAAMTALIAFGGVIVGSTGTASADGLPGGVSCYGDYCSGQDPVATGCDKDAITIASAEPDDGAGQVDLRWSPTCKTNWARWQQYPTGWCVTCTPNALIAVQDTRYTQELDWFDNGTTPADNGTYWTPMIYSPVHKVYAGVYMPCGDDTLLGAAVDCALNGLVRTGAY
jgi:hypothetical protein